MAACSSGGGGNSNGADGGSNPSGGAGGDANAGNSGDSGNAGGSGSDGAVTITVLNEGAVGIGVGVVSDLLVEKKKGLLEDETLTPRVKEEDFNYEPGKTVNPHLFGYLYQQIINEKMKEKNIVLKTEDWGWGEPLIQKQTAGFLAKNIPDIIVGETQMPGFAQQGLLEPFPDDMADYIRENIAPAAWKPMEYDGKISRWSTTAKSTASPLSRASAACSGTSGSCGKPGLTRTRRRRRGKHSPRTCVL